MKMKTPYLIVSVIFAVALWFLGAGQVPAQNQEIQFSARPVEKLKASSISWQGHFGGRKEEPKTVYCLMSQGGFLAPTSKNYESLIKQWLAEHTDADAVVVHTLEGMMTAIPDSKMKSVWVVENDEYLNIYLVRQGGCPAGTMLLNRGDKAHVTQQEYEKFAKKIVEAEALAKQEKLGIWAKR